MKIERRIEKLERQSGVSSQERVTAIVFCSVKPKADGSPPDPGVPQSAWVLAGPMGESVRLQRGADEAPEDFEGRVERERRRIHDGN